MQVLGDNCCVAGGVLRQTNVRSIDFVGVMRAQELRKEAVQRLEAFTKSPQYADLLVGLIVQVTTKACGCCPVPFS